MEGLAKSKTKVGWMLMSVIRVNAPDATGQACSLHRAVRADLMRPASVLRCTGYPKLSSLGSCLPVG